MKPGSAKGGANTERETTSALDSVAMAAEFGGPHAKTECATQRIGRND